MKQVLAAFVLSVILLAACGGDAPPAAVDEPTQPSAPAEAIPADESTAAALPTPTLGHVRVVDIEGRPLPGIVPIVTVQPNAFETPVVLGTATGEDGRGSIIIPAGKAYYVRAWDAGLRLFANNFYRVAPDAGAETELMEIVMVPAAAIAMVLVAQDGAPAAGKAIELMLEHPTQGPWWPDRAQSDSTGAVTFPAVPPGVYNARITASGIGSAALPRVELRPGTPNNLGVIALR